MDTPASITEARRQRDVLVRYGDAFRGIPRLELDPFADKLPEHFTPRLSRDASLTAFAQLACLRLGASRAMISLIDGERQNILAESTPEIYLRPTANGDDVSSSLWLGNISIPRTSGICEQVLNLNPTSPAAPEEAVVVIDDLAQDYSYTQRSYVNSKHHLRFYAGVALTSPKGAIVGALCIFDDKPRQGLQRHEVLRLHDLSATIVEYLDSYMVKAQYRRGEKLTRALLSFADGASAVRPFESEHRPVESPPLQDIHRPHAPVTSGLQEGSTVSSSVGNHARHQSVNALQESILPAHARSMFARAANVIRASSDLDGVLILDASIAGIASKRRGISSARTSEDELAKSDTASQSSSHEEDDNGIFLGQGENKKSSSSGKACQVLASASSTHSDHGQKSSAKDYRFFAEANLAQLLRTSPKGRIFNVTADGEIESSTDDSGSDGIVKALPVNVSKRKPVSRGQNTIAQAVRSLLPDARSTAFVPLWDYERSRWFAGCLCWSNRPERQLSARVDLAYLKVFGHSIMTELSRLDALAADQAKTSFVASISHELRSPLHGILGTLEFLRDTTLDSFQKSMLNSLDACGNTLLDTINHVLDYAKVSDITKHVSSSSKRLKGTKGVRLSSKPLKRQEVKSRKMEGNAFNVALVTEEVVEAVFSAQSYITANHTPDMMSETSRTSSVTSSMDSFNDGYQIRKDRFVILDIAGGQDWSHHIPVGSWRRIGMYLETQVRT
jgi:hypothetical protein